MSQPIAFVNGQFVPASGAAISLHDAGFVWGAVVTDRVRTFEGRLFRTSEHLPRFRENCRLARIRINFADERIVEVSEQLVARNRKKYEVAVIWLATPGVQSGFASSPDMRIPTFIVRTETLNPLRHRRLTGEGARLISRRATLGIDPRIKHRSRLPWWVATEEVHDLDRDAQPLLVDSDGHVLETPTANVLAVLHGVVTSPPAGTVLPGVSLNVVRELCQAHAIPFAERPMTVADLASASEVLLTNTTYCVAGVSRVNEFRVPFPGPILNRLLDAWTELVGTDVRPPAES